jgi:Acetyltransferase (GNAT) domain
MKAGTAAEYDPSLVGAFEPLASFVPAAWGRGDAYEALSALIGYGFTVLGLSQMVAVNNVPHEASNRMVRRLRFKVTGECNGPRYRLRTYVFSAEAFTELPVVSSRVMVE